MTTEQQTTQVQDLVAAQRARFDATIAGDVQALEYLIGDDLTYFHSTARVDTKRSFIDGLHARGLPYKAFRVEDEQVRILGDGAGIITAVIYLTLQNAEGENTHPSRCTSVWARREGQWQEVSWQATRVPE